MRIQHPVARVVVIVVAAMAIAVVANAFRGPKRQLKLPGWYPNATTAPKRAAAAPATPAAPSPAPALTPTATIAETPVTTTTAVATTTTIAPPTTTRPPSTPAPQQPPTQPKIDLSRFKPHPDSAYVEISGDDAVALHKSGVLFLDARRSDIFAEGHIPGARTFSVWESDVDDKVTALYEERQDPEQQAKPVVIYCSGGACEDSHMLAQKLWAVQFNNVYVYKDGFPDWQKRSLPVNKGANP